MYEIVLSAIILLFATKASCSKSHTINMCNNISTIDISEGIHMSNEDIFFKGVQYKKGDYYIDEDTGQEKGCICRKATCLRKCCPFGFAYHIQKRACVEISEAFNPSVWDNMNYEILKGVNASQLFHFVSSFVNCTRPEVRIRIKAATDFHLRLDGNLYVEVQTEIPPWTTYGPDKYCIDTFVSEDPDTNVRHTQLDALLCFADKKENSHYILSSTCMIISCVFILATVAVYGWLPELRNLHGRVLVTYLLCIFVGFACLTTMQILLTIDNITSNTCVTLTFIIYFSLLSAFFWLNVMCFDIWWTFSGKRGLSEKMSLRARFMAYSLYAFGIPSALTILLIALEFSGLPPRPYLPMLRIQGCFIYGNSKLIYFYGPILVLCLANMTFFILTALKITEIKRQTSVLKSKESSMHDQHRNDKQRFLLYIKLFTVMGINWILEVISAVYPDADSFWRFTDAYNVLIGLIIFIIFVCKRKIFRLIKKRIKEKFRGPDEDADLRDSQSRRGTVWKHNRLSLDTIRTSMVDSDNSMKTAQTQI